MFVVGLLKTRIPSDVTATLEPIKDNEEAVRNYGIHLATKMCKKILAYGFEFKALHLNTENSETSVMAILQNLGLIDKAKIISMPLKQKRVNEDVQQFVGKIHGKGDKSKIVGLHQDQHGKRRKSLCQESFKFKQSDAFAVPDQQDNQTLFSSREGVKEDPPSQPINRIVVLKLPASRLPWLMLADDPNSSTARRAFFSLDDKNIYEIELPEAKGKYCVGSSEGWLIIGDTNLKVGLLNPFTRLQTSLPPQHTFERQYQTRKEPSLEMIRYIHKAFLSSNPAPFSLDGCVALAIQNGIGGLAFSRPGGCPTDWITIPSNDMNPFQDALFYKGKFCAVSHRAELVVCDLGPVPEVTKVCSGPSFLWSWSKYLVNLREILLLVGRRKTVGDGYYKTLDFNVFALVLDKEEGGEGKELKWKKVKNLRSFSLFVGGNSSICVSTDDIPGCKGNCIYFTDDCVGDECVYEGGPGLDMGVFNYADRTIEPLYPGVSQSRLWPPVWVSPNPDPYDELARSTKHSDCVETDER